MPSSLLQPSPSSRTRRRAIGAALFALLVAIGWLIVITGNPLPSTTVVMATGPEGSANAALGLRYREVLLRAGVNVRLLATAGGLENVARLQDETSGASVGFVESGLATRQDAPGLTSLGAVAVEPLWMFFRADSRGTIAERLVGKRISIEAEGSGTRLLVRRLLEVNRLDVSRMTLLSLSPEEGADALIRGEVDAAMMLTSWQSPAVQRLLATDGVVLEGFPRADAYVARYPVFSKVVLPAGAGDLARNVPPSDVSLIAVETNLVIRKKLHPALQYLLLEAAAEIHGGAEVFHRAGRYPAAGTIDLPMSSEALTFFKSGRPFVYRYLPFWLAALAERLVIVVLPLFVILLPLLNLVPKIYSYLTERRIFKLYRDLQLVEGVLEAPGPSQSPEGLLKALDELAHRANHLKVPISYIQRLYIVKSHIAMAREEVARRLHGQDGERAMSDQPRSGRPRG
jgi:TRAP-type uncharacterized transport system substrate-binding protein